MLILKVVGSIICCNFYHFFPSARIVSKNDIFVHSTKAHTKRKKSIPTFKLILAPDTKMCMN
jgi:hypothetical protein